MTVLFYLVSVYIYLLGLRRQSVLNNNNLSSRKTVSHYRDSRVLTVRDIRRRSEEKKGGSGGGTEMNSLKKFYETQTRQTFFQRIFKPQIKKKDTRMLINEEIMKTNEENLTTERKLITEEEKDCSPRNNATIRPQHRLSRNSHFMI
jgi:hypothetical protein